MYIIPFKLTLVLLDLYVYYTIQINPCTARPVYVRYIIQIKPCTAKPVGLGNFFRYEA